MYRTIAFILFFQCGFFTQAQTTIIHAGSLLPIPGGEVKLTQSVIVRDGLISEVHDGFLTAGDINADADSVQIIDLSQQFVLPGLIDLHVHITLERDPEGNRHEWTTLSDVDYAYRAIPFLRRTLEAGFTTVRDVGARRTNIMGVKRAVDEGYVAGPRIIAAIKGITPTGGHGDFHGYRKEITEAFEPLPSVCDGADDCRRAVRALVKQGAEVIKITATGGVLSNTSAGVGLQFTQDELNAIVATAHSLGRKVAAHAHEADGINAALRAGVNSIEHGSYLDDESVRLFNETGAYLVPTLLAGVTVEEELRVNEDMPMPVIEKIKLVAPVVEASFKRALAGGVKIAFGTDSGVSKHGTNAREFEIMVKYGMDENAALQAATVNAADLLDMSDQIGTIEKGKIADIIAVNGNPLTNIRVMSQVSFVMKDGALVSTKE